MPVYDYKCPSLHTLELAHSIHDEPEVLCAQCGKRMVRTPKATTIKFTGKGWASTGD